MGEKLSLIVSLQETKLSVCDDFLCSSLGGNSNCNFSFRLSKGASGGLLTLWDSLEVEVWSSVSNHHFLLIHAKFIISMKNYMCAMCMLLVACVLKKCCGLRYPPDCNR